MSQEKKPVMYKGRNYDLLKFQASVLYIKHGLSAEAIHQQLDIAMPTLSKWNKQDRWDELRPDMLQFKEYRAAVMYIDENLNTGLIAQKLSVSEITVKMWVTVNRWDVVKNIMNCQDLASGVAAMFCSHVKFLFPKEGSLIEVAFNSYIKSIKPLNK